MRRALGITSILCVCVISLPTIPAGASFAGRNGRILFSSSNANGGGIFSMRPDGTGRTRLSRGNDGLASWSPDGTQIAFVRGNSDYTENWMMVMNADGSGKHRVGTPSSGIGCGLQPPRWSYDGLFIAYADDCYFQERRVAQIRVASADGTADVAVTDFESSNHLGLQPWSPNLEESLQLVFVSNRDGDGEVYVADSDGSNVTALTSDDDDQFAAVWSPAGGDIAFTTQTVVRRTSARNSIWSIDPTGGEPTLVVGGTPNATAPLWSPDGARLAYTHRTRLGATTAIVVDADGSNELVIGKNLDIAIGVWAPASNALLFGGGDVIRAKLTSEGVRIRNLTGSRAYESGVDWQARPAL